MLEGSCKRNTQFLMWDWGQNRVQNCCIKLHITHNTHPQVSLRIDISFFFKTLKILLKIVFLYSSLPRLCSWYNFYVSVFCYLNQRCHQYYLSLFFMNHAIIVNTHWLDCGSKHPFHSLSLLNTHTPGRVMVLAVI